MSDAAPENRPKTQVAFSGGPPKPPKKTARGLEDASSGDPNRAAVVLAMRRVERGINEIQEMLHDSKLSEVDRTKTSDRLDKIKECFAELQESLRKENE